ncbi:hypothetical protein BT93_H3403 [Corymbia citriodora subsp. variegata]|nr:hypothetical protein BT93_H3403 [Corymbia citriodora subsp. variegata]
MAPIRPGEAGSGVPRCPIPVCGQVQRGGHLRSALLRMVPSQSEYENFEECIAFIEDFMVKNGPFDGLLGFSQGAVLAAALPGMQAEGLVLTKVPKVKFLILISGGKLGGSKYGAPPLAANAFSSPVNCPSLHLIGENDFQKPESIDLLDSFVDPMVVHHPEKHTIPSLDDQSLEVVNNFIEKIRNHAATCIATSYGDNINSHL